jgi:hypothetical protein
MYSRICFSSRPTVETKYPRAQKLSPVKFLGFPINLRAMWMALFPFTYPTTCDTEYLGGIDTSIGTWSRIKCPSSIRLSRCIANCFSTSPNWWRRAPYNAFLRYFGMNTMWYWHSHLVWLRLSTSFTKVSFPCDFKRFTDRRLSFFTPELSNCWSPPAKLGVYP